MTQATKIEWAEHVWNPLRGCSRVSEGCRNCYAERQAIRHAGPGGPYEGLVRSTPNGSRWTGEVRLVEEALLAPLRRKKPTRYFVNSMSDLFHEKVPDEWLDRIYAIEALCPQHEFLHLTKRSERRREYLSDRGVKERIRQAVFRFCENGQGESANIFVLYERPWPLPNVWEGTSVEDQATADERIPVTLATPAAVRWVSYEPALGPIQIVHWLGGQAHCCKCGWHDTQLELTPMGGAWFHSVPECGEFTENFPALDGIVTGGESGPGARPMHPDWPRAVRDQCAAAGVSFFFKQWGEHLPVDSAPGKEIKDIVDPDPDRQWFARVGKKAAGRLLDGREHNDLPEVMT